LRAGELTPPGLRHLDVRMAEPRWGKFATLGLRRAAE